MIEATMTIHNNGSPIKIMVHAFSPIAEDVIDLPEIFTTMRLNGTTKHFAHWSEDEITQNINTVIASHGVLAATKWEDHIRRKRE